MGGRPVLRTLRRLVHIQGSYRKTAAIQMSGPSALLQRQNGNRHAVEQIAVADMAFGDYLMSTSLKGVSSMKLHRDLGITQKTAWMMAHKIREGWKDANSGNWKARWK